MSALETIFNIIIFLLILGLIVAIHEWGHLIRAIARGMTVNSYSIGFGPSLIKIHYKGIDYHLRLIPLGGYVDLNEDQLSIDPNNFRRKSAWARLDVLLAGPMINLLLGWVLLTVFLTLPKPTHNLLIAASVLKNSQAEKIGVKANDIVLMGNNERFRQSTHITQFIKDNRGKQVTMTVVRSGQEKLLMGTVDLNAQKFGIMFVQTANFIQVNPWEATILALEQVWQIFAGTILMIFWLLLKLLTGASGSMGGMEVGADSISGPLGIYLIVAQFKYIGYSFLVLVAGMISVAVGVFNLLPIPALDGGRAVFALYEASFKKKLVSEQKEAAIHHFGLMALLVLFIFITYLDIHKF